MIRCFHVSKRYGEMPALRDVTFHLEAGEFCFLTGASGAGKTTLLRLLYRDELPTSGQLIVNGRNLATMSRGDVPAFRQDLGVVFQDAKLIEDRSALENVALVGRVMGQSRAESLRRAREVLRFTGVEDRADLYPAQLSGGEKQRVGIARSLMNAPVLLLADEPTGNLDPDRAIEVLRVFRAINRRGTTVMIATHDPDLIAAVGQRTLVLEDGVLRSLTAPRAEAAAADEPAGS